MDKARNAVHNLMCGQNIATLFITYDCALPVLENPSINSTHIYPSGCIFLHATKVQTYLSFNFFNFTFIHFFKMFFSPEEDGVTLQFCYL